MARAALLPLALLLLGAAPDRLERAQREAAAASARAEELSRAARGEGQAADRAAAGRAALAERVRRGEAALAAARAQAAGADARLAAQRARLGEAEQPLARLLAALQSLARRPALASVAQPGSIDDLVHLRAMLGATLPAVRARTVAARSEADRAAALGRAARSAAQGLHAARGRLEAERTMLAVAEAEHRARARALDRDALGEEDRALALGEEARDLADMAVAEGAARATAATLAGLPAPLPRPLPPGVRPPAREHGLYRLPVAGPLTAGFGEVAPSGARSRGLTFATRPGAPVRAPAAGIVRHAGAFRGWGVVVILDHGAGWSTTLTGLSRTRVAPGDAVRAGTILGRAGQAVGAELRRRGQPVNPAGLL